MVVTSTWLMLSVETWWMVCEGSSTLFKLMPPMFKPCIGSAAWFI